MKTTIFDKCAAKTNALELSFERARPCCVFRADVKRRPINPKLGVNYVMNRFKEYTNDEIAEGCKKCIIQESNGARSKRLWLNSFIHSGEYDLYYDFQLSNLCNLACKMCSPNFSSRLVKPWKFYRENGYIEKDIGVSPVLPSKWNSTIVDKIFDDINERTKDKKVVVEVKGGEPTMQTEFNDFFNRFENIHNVRLDLITNLQKLPDYFLENVSKFHKVNIGVSIEGTEETYEYIRTLGKWNTFEKNIKTLCKEKKSFNNDTKLIFHPKIVSYGIGRLQDLLDFMDYGASLGFQEASAESISEIIWSPNHSSPLYLPKAYVSEVMSNVEHKRIHKLKKLLRDKNVYTKDQMDRTLKFIELTDVYNKTDFWKTPTGKGLSNYL